MLKARIRPTGTVDFPASALTVAAAARAMPTQKTGQPVQAAESPARTRFVSARKLTMTRLPPASAPMARTRPTTTGRPARNRRVAASRTTTSAALTTTGAQTGPTHATGTTKRTSHVSNDGGRSDVSIDACPST